MNPPKLEQLLASLHQRGVQIWLDGSDLRYRSPAGALTPELLTQLKEQKPAVIEFLQHAAAEPLPDAPVIRPRTQTSDLPLSFAQQRLWFLDQLEPNCVAYNIPMTFRLKGNLEVKALRESLGEIVRRHEALRTRFEIVEGVPFQVVEATAPFELPTIDLVGMPDQQRETEARRLCVEEAERPFDLTRGPMLRAKLFRIGPAEHIFILVMHHIASDGWSLGLLFAELKVLYQAFCTGQPSPLPQLTVQYADFALWQRDWLQGAVVEKQFEYWKKQLANIPAQLELPTDRPRAAVQSYRGTILAYELPKTLLSALNGLSRQAGASLYMTLLAALQTLLFRYTGQEDVVVGSTIAGRNRREVENLIGFFVNTLVLRGDLSGNPSFRTLLGRTRDMALGAYAHQDLPFEKLVELLHPDRDASRSPFFQVALSLQNTPGDPMHLTGLEVNSIPIDSNAAKIDLTIYAREDNDSLRVAFEYNTDLFDAETIRRMMSHYQILLEAIVSNPDQRISELPMLGPAERQHILMDWNRTELDYPRNRCLHELFEDQAQRQPEAIALVHQDQRLTYRELDQRANRLAHQLQTLGVAPGKLVAICAERSLEMIVGLFAILKAGGAYVPLDPNYPKDRLEVMINDARPQVLLTQTALRDLLPPQAATVINLDDLQNVPGEASAPLVGGSKADGNSLAYVLYTSGSTGIPKGVAIEHHSAVSFAFWARQVFTDEELSGVLFATSICFDLSIFELFATLANGGKVILAKNALELPSLPAANEVKLVNTVPSAIAELVRSEAIPKSVITVNLAGEPLPQSLVEKLYEHPSIQKVYDLYGPTETTTYSTFTLRERGGRATIGRPLANTQVYILDTHLEPVPTGVAGELHIGGAGLARGYLNRPELTAQKFIPNPFSTETGARMYKTGDLARFLPDGTIEYLGRLDHQVKVRGFRIELGEIEAALETHPTVREAVVMAREVAAGDKRVVAYITLKNGKPLDVPELRGRLQAKLPEYMVPSAFVTLEKLPLTANGKVDRKALPAPVLSRYESDKGFVAPTTETELMLAKIWCEILGVDKVGIHDSFFDLGGHSLQVIKLQKSIEKAVGKRLPVSAFFQYNTIAKQESLLGPSDASVHSVHAMATRAPADAPAIFVFHFIFIGHHLAKTLGDRKRVYVIDSRIRDPFKIWQETGKITTSMEELAKNCVEDLQRIQPHGPYCLAGFCFGGNMAIEVAKQLVEKGEKVSLVALLSSYNHMAMEPRSNRWLRHWPYHLRQILIHGRSYLSMKIQNYASSRKRRLGQSASGPADPNETWDEEENSITQSDFTRQIMYIHKYHPVAAKTVLFRAVTDPTPLAWKYDPYYGWKGLIREKMIFEDILCGHSELVGEPFIAEVAKKLDYHYSKMQ